MITIPKILIEKAKELEDKVGLKYPELKPLASQCFLNTIETTVQKLEDGSYFVITGDIPAMWLRDSAAQLKPYIKYADQDPELKDILRSVIAKHAFYVNFDPYSNAFNASAGERMFRDDTNFKHALIWERKYEVDSLCASLYLSYEYYELTKDNSIFTPEFHKMIETIYKTFSLEQDHQLNSQYYFNRGNCPKSDTLANFGKGRPVNHTGMTWSGFRPSDDACTFGYLIPSNMMAVVAMRYAAKMAECGFNDLQLSQKCLSLSESIDDGIQTYGIYDHYKYGKIYAYETDGFGNYNLMDDANSPSLLSIPYIGYKPIDDKLYQNTRRFILSEDNPYYFSGKVASGIGSPHTPHKYIWHISLVMQILTSDNAEEINKCFDMLSRTHNGTNFMHEGFHADDPSKYSRPWFAWANTLFAQMLESIT